MEEFKFKITSKETAQEKGEGKMMKSQKVGGVKWTVGP